MLYHLCWKDQVTLQKTNFGNSIDGSTGLWHLSFAKSDVKDEK